MDRILCIGHSFIIDNNRKFWSHFTKSTGVKVDLIVPKNWKSKLNSNVKYVYNAETDDGLNIIPVGTMLTGSNSFYTYNQFAIWNILSKNKYDAIYMWQETWSVSAFDFNITRLFTKNRKTPYFLNVCENQLKNNFFPYS